jgi:ABC-type glutathione transport system ATPase component
MYMRLGFSVAMHINPDILLLDEVLAVGDEAFQQKCYGKIWDFKRSGGSIVFVSHDAGAVERICDHAMLLEEGRAVEQGAADDVLRAYHRRLADTAVVVPVPPASMRYARSPATVTSATSSPRASRWRSRCGCIRKRACRAPS